MSESEEELFLHKVVFMHGLVNLGKELEKMVSFKNLEEIHENAQLNTIEEATEGLFNFDQTEVSIGSVQKGTETNANKASKKDIIAVDDKELLARNSERIPNNTKKVTFWCLRG